MGGVKDFFFGKDEKAAHPYQSQQFGQQEQMLSDAVMGNMQRQPQLMGNLSQGFMQAGQKMPGQMNFGQTAGKYVSPKINFTKRSPYEFSQPEALSMPDLYTPQYEMAKSSIMDQGAKTQEQLLSDLNKRGMLTSGAANRSMANLATEQNRNLADLSSQYSIEQGRMGLQDQQMQRQMDMDRQVNQAAEIFRQQGASDEQAQFLANQSLNAYNANLSGQAQNLAGFNSNLEARKQITAEEQLANLMRRQPLDDLFRLYQGQLGQIGGTAGTPGLISTIASSAAGAAGDMFGAGLAKRV